MARILVVYHRNPYGKYWRSTYTSHLTSFRRFSEHDIFYLNSAWLTIPGYLTSVEPDLVIFHYTFLAARLHPVLFERMLEKVAFIKEWTCRKALVPHDEQACSDYLCKVALEFGVTHVFTPASPVAWPMIYEGLDFDRVRFRTVLTGYVDDDTVRQTEQRAQHPRERSIDIGYRAWASWPFYGRHGRLKTEIGDRVKDRAPEFGLRVDISRDAKDALLGNSWFDFLLRCKYTVGCEGGSSVFDRDGSIATCVTDYLRRHPDAPFEEVEAECFPGMDGKFEYRLLGPRHLEAVLTRTCQVLVEGEYGGALKAGVHYIPIARDFSNLDDVLALVKADTLRSEMVDRAYDDIIGSGDWTYRAFVDLVLGETLAGVEPSPSVSRLALARNRLGTQPPWERIRMLAMNVFRHRTYCRLVDPYFRPRTLRELLRDAAVILFGEEQLWHVLVGARNRIRRVTGRPPLDVGEYAPSDAELARRKRKAEKRTAAN